MTDGEKKEKVAEGEKVLNHGLPKKILIDTMPPRSGLCAFQGFLYAVAGVLGALYVAFILDRPAFQRYADQFSSLGYLNDLFLGIEEFSPFHQLMESDEELIQRLKKNEATAANKVKVFTKEELALYNGAPGSPGTYLAILGQVIDVGKGADYYGPGGGYAFFTGRDGSRAFVTGQFDEEGLVDDVRGLSNSDYLGLKEWEDFYMKDYTPVGVLEGRFYTREGEVTEEWKELQASISKALQDRDNQDVEKQVFPPCNVEWSRDKGSRYWCTTKSGGISRKWVGVPRRLFYPGREERCACVRTTGAPSTDPASKVDTGDLDNPHLKEYAGCAADSAECWNHETAKQDE